MDQVTWIICPNRSLHNIAIIHLFIHNRLIFVSYSHVYLIEVFLVHLLEKCNKLIGKMSADEDWTPLCHGMNPTSLLTSG
jgi:hypothetical protein